MSRLKVVVAPDSFKECLSAPQVAEAMAAGVRAATPDAEVTCVPMADGGEGTVQALVAATQGSLHRATVTGALGELVEAEFGILGDGETAVIEMAAASGLPLVPPERRNPTRTTTFGTGELIRAALDRGARRIILGIGGSATVDGGAGMAQALGVRLLGAEGQPLGRGGGALERLDTIDVSGRDPRLADVTCEVACDVDNPLLGPRGAARVYAPQKGATAKMVESLEANLARLADVIQRDLDVQVRDLPGAGAAGGLGAGLVAFLDATLRPGIELMIEAVHLDEALAGADLVLVGEGQLDGQTAFGKVPVGVARTAAKRGVPTVALAGALGEGWAAVLEEGVSACFAIADGPMGRDTSYERAAELLERTAEQVTRLFLAAAATERECL